MAILRTCKQCGKVFETKLSKVKSGGGKFCSLGCCGLAKRNRVERVCWQCGKVFKVRPSRVRVGAGKFCSYECRDLAKRKRVEITCEQCGKVFSVIPARAKGGRGRFCSKKCLGLSQRTRIEKICEQCGKVFDVVLAEAKRGGGRFCSYECRGRSQKTGVKRICEQCGKVFSVKPSVAKNGGGRFCSNDCKRQARTGEGSPAWRGGISLEPYGLEWTDKLREEIRKRDNHTCIVCDEVWQEGQDKFPVHHINYCKTDNRPENLITLCRSCHSGTNSNREYWQLRLALKGPHWRVFVVRRLNLKNSMYLLTQGQNCGII